MKNINNFVDAFVTEDYFIVFLIIMVMILIVLLVALIKSKKEYSSANVFQTNTLDDDLLDSLKSNNTNEELPPIDRNINEDIKSDIHNSYSEIDEYEGSEEENAVISTDELEKKTQERMEILGITDNQAMIQKYEDEQEKKAIISYEQLLKNASNITITYKEEDTPKGSPKVNKIEVQEKEVSIPQSYIEEEQFLKILKEFRMSLPSEGKG